MPSPITCFVTFYRSLGALRETRIVSKPQLLSKLRYVNIVVRPDETAEEQSYRAQYESLQDWNNAYWAENNELFKNEKAAYIKANFGDIDEEEALSHDQLAPFYMEFLEKNKTRHIDYNTIWYKNHIALLSSSVKAKLSRLKANLNVTSSQIKKEL